MVDVETKLKNHAEPRGILTSNEFAFHSVKLIADEKIAINEIKIINAINQRNRCKHKENSTSNCIRIRINRVVILFVVISKSRI